MKRSLTLIIAAGLTTTVALIFVVSALAGLVPESEARHDDPVSGEDVTGLEPANPPQIEPVDSSATAHTAVQQLEESIQAREATLKAELARRQEALAGLDSSSQARIVEMQAELAALQAQVEQTTVNLQSVQANIAALQQAIQADGGTYQNELTKLTSTENQVRLELEAATNQLDAIYSELAQRQVDAQLAAAQQQSAGGAAVHRSDDDDDGGHGDHEEHDRHEDGDDDDHDDDHEENDDDD
jgi:chromosome segregation ATPase